MQIGASWNVYSDIISFKPLLLTFKCKDNNWTFSKPLQALAIKSLCRPYRKRDLSERLKIMDSHWYGLTYHRHNSKQSWPNRACNQFLMTETTLPDHKPWLMKQHWAGLVPQHECMTRTCTITTTRTDMVVALSVVCWRPRSFIRPLICVMGFKNHGCLHFVQSLIACLLAWIVFVDISIHPQPRLVPAPSYMIHSSTWMSSTSMRHLLKF